MAEYTALAPLFTDIANAIRSKTGETGQITANNFPQLIMNLNTGIDMGVFLQYEMYSSSTTTKNSYVNRQDFNSDSSAIADAVLILSSSQISLNNGKCTSFPTIIFFENTNVARNNEPIYKNYPSMRSYSYSYNFSTTFGHEY